MEEFFDLLNFKCQHYTFENLYPWVFLRCVKIRPRLRDRLVLSDKPVLAAVYACIIITSCFGRFVSAETWSHSITENCQWPNSRWIPNKYSSLLNIRTLLKGKFQRSAEQWDDDDDDDERPSSTEQQIKPRFFYCRSHSWAQCSVSCKAMTSGRKHTNAAFLSHTHTHICLVCSNDIFHREKWPNGRCQGLSVSSQALEGKNVSRPAYTHTYTPTEPFSCQCGARLKRGQPHRHSCQSGAAETTIWY